MASIFKDEWPDLATKIVSVLVYDGLPVTTLEVVRQIRRHHDGQTQEETQWQNKKLIASI
ncbi:MAG TPA: hypothetical protein VHL99_07230, partial [Candidatus Binatia bacterium]|nr:hypothetical protein [Candidatus Binatia bacterium]